MAGFDVWDVVRVPFPYTSRPVQQQRPALVVAHHRHPGSPTLLWVLMITSAGHRRWSGDVDVSDLSQAGLPAASMVRSAKIATIDAADANPLGVLPHMDRRAIQRELAARLAAAAPGQG